MKLKNLFYLRPLGHCYVKVCSLSFFLCRMIIQNAVIIYYLLLLEKCLLLVTPQKMKFSIKDFFSKCDQIRRKLRIWSHLQKKSLTENFIFSAVIRESFDIFLSRILLLENK